MIALAYWVFLLSACAIMVLFGQSAERRFIGIILLATVLTIVADRAFGNTAALPTIALIDLMLLGVGLFYVIRIDRYWPIWFSGFHLNALATEVGSIVFPSSITPLHVYVAGAWALPALGTAAIGVALDYRMQGRDA